MTVSYLVEAHDEDDKRKNSKRRKTTDEPSGKRKMVRTRTRRQSQTSSGGLPLILTDTDTDAEFQQPQETTPTPTPAAPSEPHPSPEQSAPQSPRKKALTEPLQTPPQSPPPSTPRSKKRTKHREDSIKNSGRNSDTSRSPETPVVADADATKANEPTPESPQVSRIDDQPSVPETAPTPNMPETAAISSVKKSEPKERAPDSTDEPIESTNTTDPEPVEPTMSEQTPENIVETIEVPKLQEPEERIFQADEVTETKVPTVPSKPSLQKFKIPSQEVPTKKLTTAKPTATTAIKPFSSASSFRQRLLLFQQLEVLNSEAQEKEKATPRYASKEKIRGPEMVLPEGNASEEDEDDSDEGTCLFYPFLISQVFRRLTQRSKRRRRN